MLPMDALRVIVSETQKTERWKTIARRVECLKPKWCQCLAYNSRTNPKLKLHRKEYQHFVALLLQLSFAPRFVNCVLSAPPSVCAPAIRATEMRAAMRPYSIAVAPDSSFMKRANTDTGISLDLSVGRMSQRLILSNSRIMLFR